MNTTAKLLLHCPDQPGILAEVTNFITINKGNIVYLDQYVDHVENIFFMRIEWEIKDFFIPKNKIEGSYRRPGWTVWPPRGARKHLTGYGQSRDT